MHHVCDSPADFPLERRTAPRHVTIASGLFYLVPMVIAIVGGTAVFGQQKYFPLAAQVLGFSKSLKIFPTAASTLVRPHGHIFKVTPKGADAAADGYEAGIFLGRIGSSAVDVPRLDCKRLPPTGASSSSPH
jgi:cellulose synthase (UDP-forming)